MMVLFIFLMIIMILARLDLSNFMKMFRNIGKIC